MKDLAILQTIPSALDALSTMYDMCCLKFSSASKMTPRSFTCFTRSITVPNSSYAKIIGCFFREKVMTKHLDGLMIIRFKVHQFAIASSWRCRQTQSLIEWIRKKILRTSAYDKRGTSMTRFTSLKYSKKIKSPRWLPWGIPDVGSKLAERWSPTAATSPRSERYERNQLRRLPLIPSLSSLAIAVAWFSLSNYIRLSPF